MQKENDELKAQIQRMQQENHELKKQNKHDELCVSMIDECQICLRCACNYDNCECNKDIKDHTDCFCAWCVYIGWSDDESDGDDEDESEFGNFLKWWTSQSHEDVLVQSFAFNKWKHV